MDFGVPINTISMELSIFCFNGARLKISMLTIVFISARNADPGEMMPYEAFHLGFHCLPKYLFTDILNENA